MHLGKLISKKTILICILKKYFAKSLCCFNFSLSSCHSYVKGSFLPTEAANNSANKWHNPAKFKVLT